MIKKRYLFSNWGFGRVDFKRLVIVFQLVVLSFLGIPIFGQAQTQKLKFENTPIDEVLKLIDQNTSSIINFSPELLKDYSYSGDLDISNLNVALERALYHTPVSYTHLTLPTKRIV